MSISRIKWTKFTWRRTRKSKTDQTSEASSRETKSWTELVEMLQVVLITNIKRKCLSAEVISMPRDCMSMLRLSNSTKISLRTGMINKRSRMKTIDTIPCWIQSLWGWHQVIQSQLFRELTKESTTLRERIKTPCSENLRSSRKTAHSSQT